MSSGRLRTSARGELGGRADDVEHAIEAGEGQDLHRGPADPDKDEPAVAPPDALETGDERSQTARVHEVDLREVQSEVVDASLDELQQVISERWRGVQVELAGDHHHRPGPFGASFYDHVRPCRCRLWVMPGARVPRAVPELA